MPKTDVFIVGVQKGGTTTLYDMLMAHERFVGSDGKELQCFINSRINWDNPDLTKYHNHFQSKGNPNDLWLDATPEYCFVPEAMGRIHRYNPDAKIIALFRDPVARAFSHWNMFLNWKKEQSDDFSTLIRRPVRYPGEDIHFDGMYFNYIERGFYARQVKRMWKYFDKSQVLFLLSEDLYTNPEEVLGQVTDFLGIEPFELVPQMHKLAGKYKGRVLLEEDAHYLVDLYAEEMKEFQTLTGLDIRKWKHAGILAS